MSYRKTFQAAFPHTIPVMTGYVFLGMAFGIFAQSNGYGFGWAGLMGVAIFAGSMQFVTVDLLQGPLNLVGAAFMALMVNARHLFYGISMLDRFKGMGAKKPYLIYSLSDETFSLLCSAKPPPDADVGRYYLCVALLDQSYWVGGSIVGGLLGAALPLPTQGIDFVMTALFVVIFVEQCREIPGRVPSLVGLAGSALCLLVFGPDSFILPSMALLALSLTALRGPLERGSGI